MFGEHRPRLIRKFLLDKSGTPIERSCPYVPRHDDVIICGFYRSGTSWLQQIVHQIRCGGGDESYNDIDQVVWYIPPYMERLDFDLNADQPTGVISNRLFRCFDCFEDAPMPIQGVESTIKYVVIVREPMDVAWSEMRSRYRNLGVDKDYDCTAFTDLVSSDSNGQSDKHQPTRPIYYPTYWEHFLSWWANKNRDNVFWLHYEDLIKDLRLCIVELAHFLGAQLTKEQLDTVFDHSTHQYMRENADKFSGEFIISLQSQMLAVEPWRPLVGRVSTSGVPKTGQGSLNLNERTKATIRWNWRHSVEKLTGFRSYSQLYAANSLVRKLQTSRTAEDGTDDRKRKNTLHLL